MGASYRTTEEHQEHREHEAAGDTMGSRVTSQPTKRIEAERQETREAESTKGCVRQGRERKPKESEGLHCPGGVHHPADSGHHLRCAPNDQRCSRRLAASRWKRSQGPDADQRELCRHCQWLLMAWQWSPSRWTR